MRVFYLFKVKKDVIRHYKNNYDELYKLLESLRYLKTKDIILGYNIFNNIVIPFNKDKMNDYIKEKNTNNYNYTCYNYSHTINDFYSDEATKMIINFTHIRIKSNKNIPIFFNNIRKINNIFVCDFDNQDYFLLNEILHISNNI